MRIAIYLLIYCVFLGLIFLWLIDNEEVVLVPFNEKVDHHLPQIKQAYVDSIILQDDLKDSLTVSSEL